MKILSHCRESRLRCNKIENKTPVIKSYKMVLKRPALNMMVDCKQHSFSDDSLEEYLDNYLKHSPRHKNRASHHVTPKRTKPKQVNDWCSEHMVCCKKSRKVIKSNHKNIKSEENSISYWHDEMNKNIHKSKSSEDSSESNYHKNEIKSEEFWNKYHQHHQKTDDYYNNCNKYIEEFKRCQTGQKLISDNLNTCKTNLITCNQVQQQITNHYQKCMDQLANREMCVENLTCIHEKTECINKLQICLTESEKCNKTLEEYNNINGTYENEIIKLEEDLKSCNKNYDNCTLVYKKCTEDEQNCIEEKNTCIDNLNICNNIRAECENNNQNLTGILNELKENYKKCDDEKVTCESDLKLCNEKEVIINNQLNDCLLSITTCNNQLLECKNDNETCEKNYKTCTSNLETCLSAKLDCDKNVISLNSQIVDLNVNLENCQSAIMFCETDLQVSRNDWQMCLDEQIKYKTDLSTCRNENDILNKKLLQTKSDLETSNINLGICENDLAVLRNEDSTKWALLEFVQTYCTKIVGSFKLVKYTYQTSSGVYYISPPGIAVSYDTARATCSGAGMCLLKLDSSDKYQALQNALVDLNTAENAKYWLCYRDVIVEGTFRCESCSGSLLSYSRYGGATAGSDSRDCMALTFMSGGSTMTDETCTSSAGYICQMTEPCASVLVP